jgi:hypothetical protein
MSPANNIGAAACASMERNERASARRVNHDRRGLPKNVHHRIEININEAGASNSQMP